jgi:hypothetical protein
LQDEIIDLDAVQVQGATVAGDAAEVSPAELLMLTARIIAACSHADMQPAQAHSC